METQLQERDETPVTVTFVRHAQPMPPSPGRDPDPPLSELGRRQAELVAKRLAGHDFHHIYSSGLARALATAEAIRAFHGKALYAVTTDINEVSRLHFTGERVAKDPPVSTLLEQERDRVLRFVNRFRHTHQPGERVLVVAHGNLIRTIMPMLGGRDPLQSVMIEFNNASVSVIDVWDSGAAILRLANCTRHLAGDQVTT